jgi:hypothetical protein
MWAELVDRPHPFLVRRIVGAVQDLGDLAELAPRQFESEAALFLTLKLELAIGPQA